MVSQEWSDAPSSGGDTIEEAEDVKPKLSQLGRDNGDNHNSHEHEHEHDHDNDHDHEHEHEDSAADSNATPRSKSPKRPRETGGSSKRAQPKKGAHIWINEAGPEGTEDEGSISSFSHVKKTEGTPEPKSKAPGTSVGTRRQPNGTVGSVYSGSKVRHIKKEDGTPLWRGEIQYEFLKLVIENNQKVFTKYHGNQEKGCTFAQIYIDCLIQSSKTSKSLKERLAVERQASNNMAMICLLVNVGRMNTTLNFFPEMRAQLRTYHSIPVLQAYDSQKDYKALQDAPRLKSILKGASEDVNQPRSIEQLKAVPVPRSNAVNLIFVISQLGSKVSERHFTDNVDFFDLTMRATISSASRARAFLWLMWWYLESNFTKEEALNNPFGPGEYKEGQDPDDPDAIPMLVPRLKHLSEEEGEAENVDTEEEKEFARKMTEERKRIMESHASEASMILADALNAEHKGIKRLKRTAGGGGGGSGGGGDDESIISDIDSRASPGVGQSPGPDQTLILTMSSSMGVQADSLDDDFELHDPHPGRGRYKRVRGKNTPTRKAGPRSSEVGGGGGGGAAAAAAAASVAGGGGSSVRSALRNSRATGTPELRATPQPVQPGSGHAILSHYGAILSHYGAHRSKHEMDSLSLSKGDAAGAAQKPRARTVYQRELEEHKARRIEWALRRRRRESLKAAKQLREQANFIIRTARRIHELPATYDSEEEGDGSALNFGLGGLLGKRWATTARTNGEQRDQDQDQTPAAIPPGYEEDDWGEEAESWKKAVQRTARRLEVWEGDTDLFVRLGATATATATATAVTTSTATKTTPATTTMAGPKAGASTTVSRSSQKAEVTPRSSKRAQAHHPAPSTKQSRAVIPPLSAPTPKSKKEMDEQITQDLLAERSDDDEDEDEIDEVDEIDDEEEVDGYDGRHHHHHRHHHHPHPHPHHPYHPHDDSATAGMDVDMDGEAQGEGTEDEDGDTIMY